MVNACVRIDDRDGQPRGTGVLVGSRHAVTAFHVLGFPPFGDSGKGRTVGATAFRVYEPQSDTTFECSCARYDESRDIAVIELRTPVESPAAPLVTTLDAPCLEMFSTAVCATGFDATGRLLRMGGIRIHGRPIVELQNCRVAHAQIVGGLLSGMSGSPLSLEMPDGHRGPAPVIGVIQRGGAGASISTFLGSDDVVHFLRAQDVQPRTIPAGELLRSAAQARVGRLLGKLISVGSKLAASATTNVSTALIEYLDDVAKGKK